MTNLTEISRERMEIALAFCRECLLWPDASGHGSRSIIENRRRPELSHAYGKMYGFQLDPSDFGHVMNAVKGWCDINAVDFSLKYSPGVSSQDAWCARLSPHAETQGGDACDVLLRACLSADRHIAQRNARTAEIDLIPKRHNPAILVHPWGNIRENTNTALAFCKECLGWKEARICNDFGYVFIRESVPKHLAATPIPPWERQFSFNENHVDHVMDAVRIWCDVRVVDFILEYFPSGSADDCWRVSLGVLTDAHGELASSALMAACLAAHRKVTLPDSPAHLLGESPQS